MWGVQCAKLLRCESWVSWYLIIVFNAIHFTVFTELSKKAKASSQEKLCAGPGTECFAVTRTWLPGSIMVLARLLLSGSAPLFLEIVLVITKRKRRLLLLHLGRLVDTEPRQHSKVLLLPGLEKPWFYQGIESNAHKCVDSSGLEDTVNELRRQASYRTCWTSEDKNNGRKLKAIA